MRLKPVNDKIVVKPIEIKEEKTSGGIILPDTVQDGKLLEGKVIAASEGMYSAQGTMIPLVVSEGDTILYNKHAQVHEHGEFLIMSVNEILSIVKEK
tara:strand:- start:1493 stop:1783 length:291 start_codon:yes stop_codon:yes gene_type:complete